jgi:hypothetical protein
MMNRLKTVLLLIVMLPLLFSIPNAHAYNPIVATGGSITYSGDYTIHTFTTSGTFEITSGSGVVEYLIIAGGGSGGGQGAVATGEGGAGGGAGGYLEGSFTRGVNTYTVTVGAGGIAETVSGALGNAGGNSVFDTITSTGGGGGAGDNSINGAVGGSGGGGTTTGASKGVGGAGTGSEGFAGGAGDTDNASWRGSGGGGGSSAVGLVPTTGQGGDGGAGTSSSITGSAVIRAGGGGGHIGGGTAGVGGTGGGGDSSTSGSGTDATVNTGSGGGGAGYSASSLVSGAGGSGIVIIRYAPPPAPDAITDLTYTNLSSSGLDLIWTEPGLNTGNVTNYMVNSTSPHSSTTNFLSNSTNLYYNVTGLNWGTDYSFSSSVLTEGGYNFTGNVINITTSSPLITGVAPTGLTVNDGDHSVNTILNLEWVAGLMDNINGFRIFFETPIGNGFTTLTSNTTTTTLYYNDTGLSPGVFYNYKLAAMNSSGISENSTAYAQTPHKLPNSVTDLTITPNTLLQFLGSWSAPTLYGTLNGYQINATTPSTDDPQTIYTSLNPGVTATISGLNPTVEYSFRVSANTYHGTNVTAGNIINSTASSEIALGDLNFDPGVNPDVEPIWYENYVVDSTTNNVQVRYSSALTVDCTITERIANNVNTYTGLSETAATGYVYHNFTVTNSGNDVLDWDCYDQTDSTINGQYALTQDQAASGVGGFGNVPLFSLMGNFTGGLYGTEGSFAGIDLITLFIVIISMLGFNKKNPALGVGVMATLLGAAWYYELIPWTSGVLGGIAVVLVLAIGQGIKRD